MDSLKNRTEMSYVDKFPEAGFIGKYPGIGLCS
jgi:hypothetical protein